MTLSALANEDKEPSKLKRPRNETNDTPEVEVVTVVDDLLVGDKVKALQTISTPTHIHTQQTQEQPQEQPLVRPTIQLSLLQQLISRSTTGLSTTLSKHKSPPWSPCPWLQLLFGVETPTIMAFDGEGVLLAGAGGNNIFIWDWDTVLASDTKGRFDFKKDVISPIIKITVPHPVSDLQWDTNDHLLVSFRGTPELHVYNMVLIADETTPSAACTKLRPPKHIVNYQGPKSVSFISDNHIVACYPCGNVCLWKISSITTLVWTWKSGEAVSSVLPLSNNLLLVGGIEGGFVLLDWRKTTRKAFASDKTPIVVTCWKSLSLLKNKNVNARDLGVQTMSIDALSCTTAQHIDFIGTCRLTWITSGGWALSLDLSRLKSKIQVHHLPPETRTLTSEGIIVPTSTKRYSTPSTSVLATTASGGLLWQTVPQTTHILPHHDKHVCQQREVKIAKELRLCWMDGGSTNYVNLKRPPKSLVIHPGKEWMIVATESKLLVFNARTRQASTSTSNRRKN